MDATDDQTGPPLLVAAWADVERAAYLDLHQHPDHLLAWSSTATVTLRTGARDWLVPPTHALWVPAGTSHAVELVRPGHGCVVMFDATRCPITWTEPTGVVVTPLIRELISHLDVRQSRHDTSGQAESLLLSLLEPVPSTTFHVPIPQDPRTRAIADALLADPADSRDLAAWADAVHTSVRTITRLFAHETGMTFAQWRAHVRVRAAITHLARGVSVGATARAVGYRKPAAFSEAFHRVTGQHPGIYQRTERPA